MPMMVDTLNENEDVTDVNGEDDDDAQDEFKKSTLNLAGLLGPTHPGRPANEEPHVKKTMKNKKEKIELICKVDQDELGFDEDEFDDLKALFTVRSHNDNELMDKLSMKYCEKYYLEKKQVFYSTKYI